MNAIKVRKLFEICGRDGRDLERRIDELRQAIRARSGAILDIKWQGGGATSAHRASILYQVPLAAAELELPAV